MAKNSPKKIDSNSADNMQDLDDNIAMEDAEELTIVEDNDAPDEIELTDIPIEEFLKDPQKMSKLTEEAEIEESTNWCPQCSDHTIFVDKICTVCGFRKGAKKSDDKDDKEEGSDVSFELMPEDDLVEDMGYGFSTGDENGDDY